MHVLIHNFTVIKKTPQDIGFVYISEMVAGSKACCLFIIRFKLF